MRIRPILIILSVVFVVFLICNADGAEKLGWLRWPLSISILMVGYIINKMLK